MNGNTLSGLIGFTRATVTALKLFIGALPSRGYYPQLGHLRTSALGLGCAKTERRVGPLERCSWKPPAK
jgi:hypothetical protein